MGKLALIGGALLCLLAVAIGAFGAHAFSELLKENGRVEVYELANRYQFYHGLALLIIGALSLVLRFPSNAISVAMILGVVVFSGSLYALAVTNIAGLGAITPIGGVGLLFGWLLFVWRLWQIDATDYKS